MPIYEYQCSACGHQLEVIQKMSDDPLKDCPECHQATLNKLISAAGFQLKGTGWYVTDYSAKGKSKSSSDSESGGSDKGGAGTKTKETQAKDASAKDTAKTKDASKTKSSDSGAAS